MKDCVPRRTSNFGAADMVDDVQTVLFCANVFAEILDLLFVGETRRPATRFNADVMLVEEDILIKT